MKKIILLLCCAQIVSLSLFGQNKLIDVKDTDTKDFPEVQGTLWVRNPDGIKESSLSFVEENSDKRLSVTLSEKMVPSAAPKNKCIVFLVLNPGPSRTQELNWYKGVIRGAIDKGMVNPGDKFAILNFNHEVNGKILYPEEKLNFTDNSINLAEQLNRINPRYASGVCAQSSASLILPAINRALKLMENEAITLPAGIIVLSDNRACSSVPADENPSDRSRRLNIPVYSITYQKATELNSINQLCKETFGTSYTDPNNFFTQASTNALMDMMNFFHKRHAGSYYTFKYQSEFEKDGESHSIKVISNYANTAFLLAVPRKNLIEWIRDNPILAGAIFLAIVVLTVLIILLVKSARKKKTEREFAQKMELYNLEKAHQEQERILSGQIAAGQNEINSIKQREQQRIQAEERKRRDQLNKEQEIRLMEQMRARGNFPWFDYSDGINSYRYEIRKPQILIGRSNECDLYLQNKTLSRRHFELNYTGQDYVVKDLGSSNGIYVNGSKVSQARLKHGDVIQAGEVVLNFRI